MFGTPGRIRPTFGRPATSRLKTSFHRKIALRNATGISHTDPNGRRLERAKYTK